MTKEVKVLPNPTGLEASTVNSLGYLYQGFNHRLFIQQRPRQEGKRAFTLPFSRPCLEGTVPGSLRHSATVHLVALPAFPGRMDWNNSGLPVWSEAAISPQCPPRTCSPSHLSLVNIWPLGSSSPGPLWTGNTPRAPQVLPCP